MFYSPHADELRAFFRDKLGMPYIDAGGGWLIFNPPGAEVGCHPGDEVRHDISFYCDEIQSTVAELKSRGVEFTADIADHGYGFVTHIIAPGDLHIQLYQPKY
jgi:hypothetical protein